MHRVVQEGRVHGLAHDVVAPEREGNIADAPAHLGAWQLGLDLARGLDEGEGVLVVLLYACAHGQHVGVEDDVLGREAQLFGQKAVGPPADGHPALARACLTLLVKGHHDHTSPVPADQPRLALERLLSLLQADRVHDALTLQAAQPCLDHRPARAVDHDRDRRHVWLHPDHVQEARHRCLGIEHAFVHVHVEHLRAVAHLLARDRDRLLELPFPDQLGELRRPGHVRALTDVHEVALWSHEQGVPTREARQAVGLWGQARRAAAHGLGYRTNVIGRGATATPSDVQPARLREVFELPRHVLGRVRKAARRKRIRQTRVRVAADVHRHQAGQLLDIGPHVLGAKRAVQADAQ